MSPQRVLVTAGAAGIGKEIVRAFAAAGARVFACDIDAPALENLTRQISGVRTGVCDVSKRADVERMVADGAAALGGLDVLVNNAGIAGPTAPVEQIEPDDWENEGLARVMLYSGCDALSRRSPPIRHSAGQYETQPPRASPFSLRSRPPGPRK